MRCTIEGSCLAPNSNVLVANNARFPSSMQCGRTVQFPYFSAGTRAWHDLHHMLAALESSGRHNEIDVCPTVDDQDLDDLEILVAMPSKVVSCPRSLESQRSTAVSEQ